MKKKRTRKGERKVGGVQKGLVFETFKLQANWALMSNFKVAPERRGSWTVVAAKEAGAQFGKRQQEGLPPNTF